MNIVFVAQRYFPIVGGVETQTRLVVQELRRRGHDVSVVAANFDSTDLPDRLQVLGDSLLVPSYDSFSDEGTPVHALTPSLWDRMRMLPVALRALPVLRGRAYHGLRRFGYAWYRRVHVPKLRRLFEGADLVHSVAGGYLGWAAQEAAQDLGFPFACTPYVHPGQYGDDDASVRFYRESDAVFALLETDRRKLVDLGVPADQVHISGVVPLLPDTSDPDGFRDRHGLGDAPLVVFVGRLVDYKGAFALLDAATQIWETLPDAHLFYIGPSDAEGRARIDALNDNRVRHLGLVSEQEKADALHACDVFCMPSEFEILPAVYLEAWTYATPVVGGMAYGLPELVEGNDAGVCVTQDPTEIAREITALLTSDARRAEMGANGRALVDRRYTAAALVSGLEDVYASLTASTPADAPAAVAA